MKLSLIGSWWGLNPGPCDLESPVLPSELPCFCELADYSNRSIIQIPLVLCLTHCYCITHQTGPQMFYFESCCVIRLPQCNNLLGWDRVEKRSDKKLTFVNKEYKWLQKLFVRHTKRHKGKKEKRSKKEDN